MLQKSFTESYEYLEGLSLSYAENVLCSSAVQLFLIAVKALFHITTYPYALQTGEQNFYDFGMRCDGSSAVIPKDWAKGKPFA